MARVTISHPLIRQFIPVLIFAGCVTLSAQNPADKATPETPAPDSSAKAPACSVQGTVAAASAGEPLRGARVILSGAEGRLGHTYSGTTDGDGRFSISGIAPGRYHFQASKNGYVSQAYHPDDSAGGETVLELLDGQQIEKVLFRLSRAAVILGRITDENGEPMVGIQVTALTSKGRPEGLLWPAFKSQWAVVKAATTNDLGEFRLFGLPPGNYYVAAAESGFADLASTLAAVSADNASAGMVSELSTAFVVRGGGGGGGEVTWFESGQQGSHHPPLYYPGVTQRSQAQRIHMTAGQETRIDIALRPEKTFTVSGRIFEPTGKPAAQTFVAIHSQELGSSFSDLRTTGVTDAQGKFEIKGVLPGSYTASATSAQDGKNLSAQQALDVAGENVTGIQMHLSGGVDLSGRVIATPGSNVDLGELQAMLWPLNAGSFATMKKDGTFTFSNVQAGTYGLQVFGLPEGWYLSSIAYGQANVLEDGLKLGESTANPAIEIVIKQGTAQIEGVVLRRDDPAPGSVVRLTPEHASAYRQDTSRTATTDQRGHFIIKDVVPGRYRATATIGQRDGDDDQETAADAQGEAIVLGERESKTVQLKLKTPER